MRAEAMRIQRQCEMVYWKGGRGGYCIEAGWWGVLRYFIFCVVHVDIKLARRVFRVSR